MSSHENGIEIVTNYLFGFGEPINREVINRHTYNKFIKFHFLKLNRKYSKKIIFNQLDSGYGL